jgi:glycerate kinase
MLQEKKTILIAPNSFKECADSVKIADLIEQNLKKISGYVLIKKPISDGGDGFLEVCKIIYALKIIKYEISTPYDSSIMLCEVGYDKKNKRIYIESANVLGLKVIPKAKRRPVKLSSKGLGDLLLALKSDIEKSKIFVDEVIIGIGGTGINDLGLGVCSRFGMKIFNSFQKELKIIPENFDKISRIKWEKINLPFKINIISDVENPLLGKNGATKIFGKQKGFSDNEILAVENGFTRVINLLRNNKLYNYPNKLSGAGGGLAAGLQIFFNAKLIQSFNFVSEIIKYDGVKSFDAIITGEGAFDKQSLMKKATGSMLEIFRNKGIPIFLCCGIIDHEIIKSLETNIKTIQLADYFNSDREAIKHYKKGIRLACFKIVQVMGN